MPLYTYILTYNDSNYVAQGTHSNFKGFVSSWATDLPDDALDGFNSRLKAKLLKLAYSGEFSPVPNRTKVWRKSLELEGKPFVVHAIETRA